MSRRPGARANPLGLVQHDLGGDAAVFTGPSSGDHGDLGEWPSWVGSTARTCPPQVWLALAQRKAVDRPQEGLLSIGNGESEKLRVSDELDDARRSLHSSDASPY